MPKYHATFPLGANVINVVRILGSRCKQCEMRPKSGINSYDIETKEPIPEDYMKEFSKEGIDIISY